MSDPLDTGAAQGVLDGKRYTDSLRDGREVWLDGQRVTDVTEHPAFHGPITELARQFDLQHDPELADLLTFESPRTGHRLARSYQPPADLTELTAVRRSAEFWFRESWGQHGRSPAFMATVIVGLYDFRNRLASRGERFGRNAEDYYVHCAENDLVLTHALGDPQIDRSADPVENPDHALRIVQERSDGIVVRGAKQLTTLAPLANEVLVYLSASFARRGSERFVVWFALPIATPGLRVLCREPFGAPSHGHRHPLGSRFDEQDSMLFFEDVFVPWERVFLLHDGALALEGLKRINAWSAYIGQVRYRERLRTVLAVATLAAESIGVAGFRNIQEDLGEAASHIDLLGHFLASAEAGARRTDGGLTAPADLAAVAIWAAETSGRAVEILRRIGSAGVLMQPTEGDLASPELRPQLDRYMRGRDIEAAHKSRLFRLAWDLVGDGFAQRQNLYEYVHRGDLARNRINLFKRHEQDEVLARVRELIAHPL